MIAQPRVDTALSAAAPPTSQCYYAFLRETGFCDFSDPEIGRIDDSLAAGARSPRELAVRIFYFVRDEIAYEVGNWQRSASATLHRRRGTCTNSANLMVALLRRAGIPAGYGVMTVNGREYFGPFVPPRLTGRVATTSRHFYVCVLLEGTWVRCDPSDDVSLSAAAQHLNPQCSTIDWSGERDALLKLDSAHIIDDQFPVDDIDAYLQRPMRPAMRVPVWAGNHFLEFVRQEGMSVSDAGELSCRYENWLREMHPWCYLLYRRLPARDM